MHHVWVSWGVFIVAHRLFAMLSSLRAPLPHLALTRLGLPCQVSWWSCLFEGFPFVSLACWSWCPDCCWGFSPEARDLLGCGCCHVKSFFQRALDFLEDCEDLANENILCFRYLPWRWLSWAPWWAGQCGLVTGLYIEEMSISICWGLCACEVVVPMSLLAMIFTSPDMEWSKMHLMLWSAHWVSLARLSSSAPEMISSVFLHIVDLRMKGQKRSIAVVSLNLNCMSVSRWRWNSNDSLILSRMLARAHSEKISSVTTLFDVVVRWDKLKHSNVDAKSRPSWGRNEGDKQVLL